jgi:hypothetical protein
MSRCAGVISGTVIWLCLLIAVSVQPPNRRVQSTPLRGPEIVAILKADFGWMAALIYRCGAADAQHVGRAFRNGFLYCPVDEHLIAPCSLASETSSHLAHSCANRHRPRSSHHNLIAPCPFASETSSRMPISPQRLSVMPSLRAERRRACPPRRSAILTCPIAYEMSSCMLISRQPHRIMLTREQSVGVQLLGPPNRRV